MTITMNSAETMPPFVRPSKARHRGREALADRTSWRVAVAAANVPSPKARSGLNPRTPAATQATTTPAATQAGRVRRRCRTSPDALRQGRIGERYIVGGENVLLGKMLSDIAGLTGRRPPHIRLPHWSVLPVAFAAEAIAQIDVRLVVDQWRFFVFHDCEFLVVPV